MTKLDVVEKLLELQRSENLCVGKNVILGVCSGRVNTLDDTVLRFTTRQGAEEILRKPFELIDIMPGYRPVVFLEEDGDKEEEQPFPDVIPTMELVR